MAAVSIGMSFICPALHSAERGSDKPIPAIPPVPTLRSLKLEPNRLTLLDGRDSRKVLVLGESADGSWVDLSSVARFKPESAALEADADGYLTPRQAGKSTVLITAAGKSARLEVDVQSIASPAVGFVRDIEPILSRAGCNSGPCHGSAKGKNGFKLALRGYDPEYDYQALINDLSGRRFNRVHVDDSLMLQKPLADIPHEGRQALVPGSRYHKTLRQWISEGAHFQKVSSNRPTRIKILPEKVELDLPGRRQQLLVIATYPDGSTRDVTREAVLSSNNEEVALVQGSTVIPLRLRQRPPHLRIRTRQRLQRTPVRSGIPPIHHARHQNVRINHVRHSHLVFHHSVLMPAMAFSVTRHRSTAPNTIRPANPRVIAL
jgi:hypothetical protein